MSAGAQGIVGATRVAGPLAVTPGAVGTHLAGQTLLRIASTPRGAYYVGHRSYQGVKGVRNQSRIRVGVGRHGGPVFRVAVRNIKFDWPR